MEFTGYKKGVNLGGWISQCGNKYNHDHYSSFITESDIARLATWGIDHIRLPVDYNVIQNEDGTLIEEGLQYIDKCIEWCGNSNLNLIIDIHKVAGYVFDVPDGLDLFNDEALQDRFVVLWRGIIKRYAHLTDRVAFELLNEVHQREAAEKWNEIVKRTIEAIRETSKDAKILVGGVFYNSVFGLTLLDPPYDENIVLNFHCYSPLIFTHQSAYWDKRLPQNYEMEYPLPVSKYSEESTKYFGNTFDDEFAGTGSDMIDSAFYEKQFSVAVELGKKYNVPIYCGEYGVIDKADAISALNWFKDINKAFEKLGIGRAVWTYKEMDFGLIDERYAEVFDELIKYI